MTTAIVPRDYQADAVTAVRVHYVEHKVTRQLVVLPTASGKTIIFAYILKARRANGPSLVLAHTEELLDQAREKILRVWPEATIGLVKAESNEWQGYDVVVSSVQTLSKDKRLHQFASEYFKTIIVDEAHHAVAQSYTKVLNHLAPKNSNVLVIGFTATANRGDKASLRKVFDKMVFYRSVDQMVQAGWLVPPISQYVNINADFSKFRTTAGDFNLKDVAQEVNTEENNKDIVRAWWKYAWTQGRKATICFSVDIAHAYALNKWFSKCPGVVSEVIHGDTPNRKELLERFRQGQIHVLVNCMVLIEGFDHEAVDCILIARPTASQGLYMQMVGRGLRPILGPDGKANLNAKPNCLILDTVGNSVNHKLVTMPMVMGGKEYKPNTNRSKDVAKQSKPRKIRLNFYGQSRTVDNMVWTTFPWLQLTAEDMVLAFPFNHPFALRVCYNFENNKWQYQHFYYKGLMPYIQVIAEHDSPGACLVQAEADAVVIAKDPKKLTVDAHWRKHRVSKKQKDMLAKLNIQLDDVDYLTIGEVSDIITSFIINRALWRMGQASAAVEQSQVI